MLNILVSLVADLSALVAGTKWRTFFMVMLSLVLIWVVLLLMR